MKRTDQGVGREPEAGLHLATATADVSQQFLQSILDALTKHIAVLDGDGCIVLVNAAWERFGRSNGLTAGGLGIGANYLKVCDRSHGACAEEAAEVARGIRGGNGD